MGPLRSSPHSFVTDYNLQSSAQYKVSLSVSYRDSSAGVSRVATAGRGRGGGHGRGARAPDRIPARRRRPIERARHGARAPVMRSGPGISSRVLATKRATKFIIYPTNAEQLRTWW